MAILTTKLTISSSNARIDAINLSLTDSLTITDPIETGKRNVTTVAAGGGEFVPASDSNTYYVRADTDTVKVEYGLFKKG